MKGKGPFHRGDGVKPITSLPLLEIAGDQRLLIERHKGVLGYDKEKICIKLSFGMVLVHGCNLEITHMSRVQLVITGKIHNIVFKRGNC